MKASVTKEQVIAAVNAVRALAETIREVGSVPSGVLYAQVMEYFSFDSYSWAIDLIKKTGLVTESNNVLTWVGPK